MGKFTSYRPQSSSASRFAASSIVLDHFGALPQGDGRSLLSTLFGPSIARTVVSYTGNQKLGTIIISTAQRRLYLVLGNGQALSYAIGVGREGMAWSGVTQISSKRVWPDWTPSDQMLKRRPDLPRHMAGGIDNPLGARAMYLGSTLTASTARTSRTRSVRRRRRAASA